MSFWKRVVGDKPPSNEALQELRQSQQEYNRVASRGPKVAQMTSWLESRQRDNHFGDDLSITFTRNKERHA